LVFWGTEGNWRTLDHLPHFPTVSERKCVCVREREKEREREREKGKETIPLIPV
jgi:hypothetical protein